jgi:hypothetical protein
LGRHRPEVIYSWLEETSLLAVPLARLRQLPVVRPLAGSRVLILGGVAYKVGVGDSQLGVGHSPSVRSLERRALDDIRH